MDGASNRAYYAMFGAARAALFLLAGVPIHSIRTHGGVIAAFGLHVVKAEHVAAEHGRHLNQAEEYRLLADYSGDAVKAEDAKDVVSWAEGFLGAVEGAIGGRRSP